MHSISGHPTLSTNPIVFLDIQIDSEFAGRMIIELRKDIVPKTAENFRALCTGEYGIGKCGKPLHYKGLRFHKVTRLFVVQSGDVVNNNGSSGESIYGPLFEDENFQLLHEEGVVSMANYGKPNTNNSQFAITSVVCNNLNGTNVVVGQVLRGFGIIADMELNSKDDGQPTKEMIIADCGEIAPGEDWCIVDTDEGNMKLPPYTQDWDMKLHQFRTEEILALLTALRQVGNQYYAQQRFFDARRKYRKADRYYNLFIRRFHWRHCEHLKCSDEDQQKFHSFSVLNNLNMAAVEIKLENYDAAKYVCTQAILLDDKCSKAFYRRGQSHLALKNYDEAIKDLRHANELRPEDKQIQNILHQAKQLLADYNREQMNALKKLFK